jgi:hypothetical protein
MKYLFLLLISFSTLAGNFVSPQIVDAVKPQAYELEAECERIEQEHCVDIANNPVKIYESYVNQEDDLLKPIYEAASNVTPCASTIACSELLPNLCGPEYMAVYRALEVGFEAYCTKLLGYEQKNVKRIRISAAKDALWQAEKLIIAQKAAYSAADAQAQKAMDCGKSTQRLLLIRNAQKSPALDTTQIKALVALSAPMKALLDTGSLVSAQEEIASFEADGVVITEADKTALIQHINGCKP